MISHEQLTSGSSTLDLRIASTPTRAIGTHTLILVHGLPRVTGMGRQAAGLLPELAEHLASESGWLVATGTLSGVGTSTGTFSATQWRQDLASIIERVHDEDTRLSLAGFGLGGALALALAASDERIKGVATFATPAHLEPWCGDPHEFRQALLGAGVVGEESELLPVEALYNDVLAINPMGAVAALPPRRLLIGHGSDDVEVPASDARDLLEAADGRGELRIIQGAGHQLRADPRMVATLLGWLDRHR
ncbi:MAG: alpha/beta fold hydrolase [Actinomycetota bacterium]